MTLQKLYTLVYSEFFEVRLNMITTRHNLAVESHVMDPHFSRASPLDRQDSFFICEKVIFGKACL